jgi:hypothetical protein
VDPPSRSRGSREQTPEYGIGTFDIATEKVQNSTTGRKNVDPIWAVLENYQVRGTRENSVCYSEMLQEQRKPDIQAERRGLLSKVIIMLPSNDCPHIAAHTTDCHANLGFRNILRTVLIWLLLTITRLIHSKDL